MNSESNILLNYKEYEAEVIEATAKIGVQKDQIIYLEKLIENLKKELTMTKKELTNAKKQIWDNERVINKYKKSLNYYMESQNAKQQDVFQQMKYT